MKPILSILLITLFLSGCSIVKNNRLIKGGILVQKEFYETIPFEYRSGLVFIKVMIEGEAYDFLFDTGAPCVISEELAQKINIERKGKGKVGDSQNASGKMDYSSIDQLSIGNLDFKDEGVLIYDLSLGSIGCMEMDGIIGANLMRKAIWKIDYQKHELTVTNSLAALNLSDSFKTLPFSPTLQGTPKVTVDINGVKEKRVTFDTGSNKYITLSEKTLTKIKTAQPNLALAAGFGVTSFGVYGPGKSDSIYQCKIPRLAVGDVEVDSTVVLFVKKSSANLGTDFFKHYDVVLNWTNNTILMAEHSENEYKTLHEFGFSVIKQGEQLLVSKLYDTSNAYKAGLRIGDTVVQVGEKRYDSITEEDWCAIVMNGLAKGEDELTLKVLKEGQEELVVVKKEKML